MEDVNKYLERLISLSKTELEKHFKVSKLGFDKFEIVNSYLIYQIIRDSKKKKNTLIYIPDKETKSQFYIPAIFTLALYNFIDNYIDDTTVYEIGGIVQKEGNRYKIITKSNTKKSNTNYKIKGSGNTIITLRESQIKKYIITNANLKDRQVKLKFNFYKDFFQKILNVNENELPSKFKYKSIIVTDKTIVDELKAHQINGEQIHKAFPFQDVTKFGKTTNNIPIDPMIYIVNDYETARKYILDKDISIRNITFIGQSKYKEQHLEISEDLNNNRIENCLLIGSTNVPENSIPDLLKWKWMLPELDYFKYSESHPINKITVENEQFSEYLKEFDCLIKQTEEEYGINLQELYKFVRSILRIVIPSPKSRLISQLDNTLIHFEREGEDIVETALDEISEYDYEDIWNEILEKLKKLIDCKKSSQLKFEKINESQKIDYLIVPKEYLEIWREETNRNKIKKVISFKEFNNRGAKNKTIVFLGFFGYNHLKSMMYNSNKISIILYPQEEEHYNDCLNNLKRETYKELKSGDRKTISGISLRGTKQIETPSELIKRIFEQGEETKINPDYSESYTTNICKKLTFENDTEDLELDENKRSVLKK